MSKIPNHRSISTSFHDLSGVTRLTMTATVDSTGVESNSGAYILLDTSGPVVLCPDAVMELIDCLRAAATIGEANYFMTSDDDDDDKGGGGDWNDPTPDDGGGGSWKLTDEEIQRFVSTGTNV